MIYRLRVTDHADRDLDRVLGSLAQHSPKAAARLAQKYYDAQKRLQQMPLSCGYAHENQSFSEELRHLHFLDQSQEKTPSALHDSGR